LKEAFSRFELFSPVSNAFPLTKQKLPLNEILLLMFKRVLDIYFERGHTNSKIRYQLKNFFNTN
jgi:hypothetical protein